MTGIVQVLAKAPQVWRVKTRLIPEYGAVIAARFAQHLLYTQLDRLAGHVPLQLWCSPDPQQPFFQYCAQRFPLSLHQQQGADLGARMAHALASTGDLPTVLIGSDCPNIGTVLIEQAFAALAQVPVVFAPAEDGGYVLVGMKRLIPCVFEQTAWSHDKVMAETRARLQQQGVAWQELAMQWDVDEPEDVRRWLSCRSDKALAVIRHDTVET